MDFDSFLHIVHNIPNTFDIKNYELRCIKVY